MHGTWKVTGYGAGPVLAVFFGAAVIGGVEWVLVWLWLIALLAVAVAALTALAIGWLMRLARARDERIAVAWAEQRAALRASRPAQVAAPQPQAVAPASVYVINVADADQAAIIRQALPGQSVPGGTRDSGPAA